MSKGKESNNRLKHRKGVIDMILNPKLFAGKWCIEVSTPEFGKTILLDKEKDFSPLVFDTEEEALDYIRKVMEDN
ncbi:MAG: hypothetical protein GX206_05260 [Clostridiales bacterium]|nr:hypothetical protein [Clostridiales bacterium]